MDVKRECFSQIGYLILFINSINIYEFHRQIFLYAAEKLVVQATSANAAMHLDRSESPEEPAVLFPSKCSIIV
jgi:hypothetical protein